MRELVNKIDRYRVFDSSVELRKICINCDYLENGMFKYVFSVVSMKEV